jgi:hypothetical protein
MASLEKATGGAPWNVSHRSIEELLKSSREGVARGDMMSMGYLALVACFSGEYGGNFAKEGKLANAILELPGQKLDDIVTAALNGI